MKYNFALLSLILGSVNALDEDSNESYISTWCQGSLAQPCFVYMHGIPANESLTIGLSIYNEDGLTLSSSGIRLHTDPKISFPGSKSEKDFAWDYANSTSFQVNIFPKNNGHKWFMLKFNYELVDTYHGSRIMRAEAHSETLNLKKDVKHGLRGLKQWEIRRPNSHPVSLVRSYATSELLGCFNSDTFMGFSGEVAYEGQIENTPEKCIDACNVKRYPYAGLENGGDCRCTGWPQHISNIRDEQCKYRCPGNPSTFCGGDWSTTVYVNREVLHHIKNR